MILQLPVLSKQSNGLHHYLCFSRITWFWTCWIKASLKICQFNKNIYFFSVSLLFSEIVYFFCLLLFEDFLFPYLMNRGNKKQLFLYSKVQSMINVTLKNAFKCFTIFSCHNLHQWTTIQIMPCIISWIQIIT